MFCLFVYLFVCFLNQQIYFEKNDAIVLNTVFCLLGSKVKIITSLTGCSYGAVGNDNDVANNNNDNSNNIIINKLKDNFQKKKN